MARALQLDRALKERGHESPKVHGRRVTDDTTLEEAIRTFRGSANLRLVSALVAHQVPALGLSGVDAGVLRVRRRPEVEIDGEAVDFGHVGDPVACAGDRIEAILDGGLVPVFSSLGVGEEGETLNVNADVMAAEVSVALKARKLVFVSSVAGILEDKDDPCSLFSLLDADEVAALIDRGVIVGGMRPKVDSGLGALRRGVGSVHIVGADDEESLLEETFTNQGSGSMLVLTREESA